MGTKIFDLATLTLKYDLLLKNFNLGHSFLTRRVRDFICVFLVTRPFHGNQNVWPSDLDVLPTLKNCNLGHILHGFLTRRGRAFIFHMCIPCSKTFSSGPWFLTYWPLPCRLTLKNCPGLWILNQRGYLLLLFTYGCRRQAMLSFWRLVDGHCPSD